MLWNYYCTYFENLKLDLVYVYEIFMSDNLKTSKNEKDRKSITDDHSFKGKNAGDISN